MRASGRHAHERQAAGKRGARETPTGAGRRPAAVVGRPARGSRNGASVCCCSARSPCCRSTRPPFLDTPGISFGGTMAQFAMVAIIAIGLNVVVGQAGLLDLGYVGFYAVGAYTVALLTSPDSPWNKVGPNGFLSTPWAWLSCVPLAMAITALAGLILGIPTLRSARRLPGDRHAGVRRDHPADGRQPGRHHQRPARAQRGGVPAPGREREAARGRVLQCELDRRRELRHLVVLARA